MNGFKLHKDGAVTTTKQVKTKPKEDDKELREKIIKEFMEFTISDMSHGELADRIIALFRK